MNLDFREARESDIAELVRLLADDELGAMREDFTQPRSDTGSKFAAATIGILHIRHLHRCPIPAPG